SGAVTGVSQPISPAVTTVYTLTATNSAGSVTAQATVNVTQDTTPPVISSVASSAVGNSAVTITWSTDELSDTQVDYGTTTSYGSSSVLSTTLTTTHKVSLSILTGGTTYHYRVKSRDAYGNLAVSGDYVFITNQTQPSLTLSSGTAAAGGTVA